MSRAGPRNRWCTGMLKTRVIAAYLRDLKQQYEIVEYIGIAADEPKRIKDACYPLVEWNMTEKDCLDYCLERGFDWGGLYHIFSRVSCWCCPLQSLNELRKLYRQFPDLWMQLEKWDESTWRTFQKTIQPVSLLFVLILKKDGRPQAAISIAEHFINPCRRNCHGKERRRSYAGNQNKKCR